MKIILVVILHIVLAWVEKNAGIMLLREIIIK